MTIEEHGQNGTIYVSDLAAAVKQPLPAVSRALRQLEQDGTFGTSASVSV